MKYNKVTFQITPCNEDFADLLSALLSDVGFETFVQTEAGVEAYIQQNLWQEDDLREVVNTYPVPSVDISYSVEEAEYGNWNQKWEEEGFKPIVIGDVIAVHNVSHTDIPEVKYDILISPCQAFGTGSHQTTRMILTQLSEMPLKGLDVVDAGTGTGILAIMCMKRGARGVYAYDIDEWSVRNTQENILLNGITSGIEVKEGDASLLEDVTGRDLVIANINRNILLADMPRFCKSLKLGGQLLLSGFYKEDIAILEESANALGLHITAQKEEDGWAMLLLKLDTLGRMDV